MSRPAGDSFDVNRGAVEGPRGGYAAGATVEGPRGNTVGRGVAAGPEGGVVAGRGAEAPVVESQVKPLLRDLADVSPLRREWRSGGRWCCTKCCRRPVRCSGGVRAPYTRRSLLHRRRRARQFQRLGHLWSRLVHLRTLGLVRRGLGSRKCSWNWATWPAIGTWFGYADTVQPFSYDYGTDITYENNNVYYGGQSVGTTAEYYQQSASLADAGSQAKVSNDGDWLPLGVFALTKSGHDESNVTIQLAVNKQAIVRGNYTDTFTDQPLEIHGSVDKKSQRVAFTIGDKKTTVFETGLYSLTKDEMPLLIQFGKDRTEQWLLVRLKQPEDKSESSSEQIEATK